MTKADIVHLRLAHQHLVGKKFDRPEEVVRYLGAVQSQDFPGGLWSIGLRMNESTEASVEQAVIDKKIVRTWPMRGTLHFLMPEDVRWMLKLLAPRVIAKFASYYRKTGLTDQIFAKSQDLLAKNLKGGKQLTRPQIYELFKQYNIPTGEMSGLFILGNLAMKGFLIFGAKQGKQQTFTLLEEWVKPAKELSREESIANLTERYFTSHGPATIQDLMWWSGMTTAEVKEGLEMVKSRLTIEEFEGKTYWMAPTTTLKPTMSTSYLLQPYDEFLIAYKDRSASFGGRPTHIEAFEDGFYSTIIIDGMVVGTWKRAVKSKTVTIKTKLFQPLSPAEEKVFQEAVDRYSKFIGAPVTIE